MGRLLGTDKQNPSATEHLKKKKIKIKIPQQQEGSGSVVRAEGEAKCRSSENSR